MKPITRAEQIEALQEVAVEVGGTLRSDYSGRGMFGRICYGIDCKCLPGRVIEEAVAHGIRGACTDNMGLGWIVYWPSIKGDELKNED